MKKIIYSVLTALILSAFVSACSEGVNENKPVASVQADASKMSATQLEAKVEACKKAIEEKKAEAEKLATELKKIPLAEMLGEKSKALKADADKISDSISKIKTQLDIYAKELAAKK